MKKGVEPLSRVLVVHRPCLQGCAASTLDNSRVGIMQSIFSVAARRDTLRDDATADRRDGGLKMDWTKPREECSAYGY
jgi:hypothetical protein